MIEWCKEAPAFLAPKPLFRLWYLGPLSLGLGQVLPLHSCSFLTSTSTETWASSQIPSLPGFVPSSANRPWLASSPLLCKHLNPRIKNFRVFSEEASEADLFFYPELSQKRRGAVLLDAFRLSLQAHPASRSVQSHQLPTPLTSNGFCPCLMLQILQGTGF